MVKKLPYTTFYMCQNLIVDFNPYKRWYQRASWSYSVNIGATLYLGQKGSFEFKGERICTCLKELSISYNQPRPWSHCVEGHQIGTYDMHVLTIFQSIGSCNYKIVLLEFMRRGLQIMIHVMKRIFVLDVRKEEQPCNISLR